MITVTQDEPVPYVTREKLSEVASTALRQAATLLREHGDELANDTELWEHTSLGSYLSLPTVVTAHYRPELLEDDKYQRTRVRAFRALRYCLFYQFWQQFHEGIYNGRPDFKEVIRDVSFWHRLNELREAHKRETVKAAGQWLPVFLYPDLQSYAGLLEQYADVLKELEATLTN